MKTSSEESAEIRDVISEDLMVREFLKAEVESPRFSSRYHEWFSRHGVKYTSIEALDAGTRKKLLQEVRPGLFATLPEDITWHYTQLEKEDWDRVLYMNQDDWTNFSDGTRQVLQGIKKLGQPRHEVLARRVTEITSQMQAGEQPPKMILVTTPDREKLVLLEGHVRATAYAASGKYRDEKVPVILGTSKKASDWAWY